jgi:hypothetical protein
MNTLQCRLRVTTTDLDATHVLVRRHQFAVGRPIDFDAESAHVAALEYALGALGAEIVGGLRVFAKRRRVELDEVEAVVDGEVENPLTVRSSTTHRNGSSSIRTVGSAPSRTGR